MRKKFVIVVLTALGVTSMASGQQKSSSIPLPVLWKLAKGDSAKYAEPLFNDSSWATVSIRKNWESQGLANYEGVAWYRARVVIPSSLKDSRSTLNMLSISLGRIDDADQVYFNGQKFGETDGWDKDLTYLIRNELINWDSENIIAVRVLDRGGNGGMYSGPYLIGQVNTADLFKIRSADKPWAFDAPGQTFNCSLVCSCKQKLEALKMMLNIEIYDPQSGEVVFRKNDSISSDQFPDVNYHFNATIKKPGIYKVTYSISSSLFAGAVSSTSLFSYVPGNHNNEHLTYPIVNPLVPFKDTPFPLENMSFTGYLEERMNSNLVQRLLQIDETGILECYYNRPGKQTWVGEYAGKYLHAASRVWRSTHNTQLKTQMDRIADILISCQNKDGYLGTYLHEHYWTEWDVWAHKYNLLGLLSYYSATGYEPALNASIKMGDLICKTFGEAKGQLNIINSSYHFGMASTSILEPMTDLYRFTGDRKYLDFCYYILKAYDYPKGPHIISSLNTIGKVDQVANGKAYEMLSNFTGIVKMYQLTADESLLSAVQTAWRDISVHKLYITGTASEHEVFQPDFVLPAGNDVSMGEGCVTTTWLQFNQALFYLKGEAQFMDEMEKSIYNHLFAAENPETGCVSYYTALQGAKPYRCSIDGHCCLASVPRGIAAIPELVFTRRTSGGLNINLYSASSSQDELKTDDGIKVKFKCDVATKFPEEGTVKINLAFEQKAKMLIGLRVPGWCKDFVASTGGKTYFGTPGTYLELDRAWDKASVITIKFTLKNNLLSGTQSYPGYSAFKLGPQVLAIDQALNPEIDLNNITFGDDKLVSASKILLPKGWIGMAPLQTKAFYKGKTVDVILVPFADAGQTGGEVRVWLKEKEQIK